MSFAGYRTKATTVTGVHLSGITTQVDYSEGIIAGLYNCVYTQQTGISIGVFNRATVYKGLQIGLLNYIENNPPWARYLPIVNAHF